MSTETGRTAAVGILCGLLVVASLNLGLFRGQEAIAEDRLFSPKPIDSRIVIAAIDNESIQKIGQWPWPRAVFARAIRNLGAAQPLALGIDVVFAEPSGRGAADDAELARALQNAAYPILLPAEGINLLETAGRFEAGTFALPLPSFLTASATKLGHVNLLLDQDNVARRFPETVHARGAENARYAALALELARYGRNDEQSDGGSERIVYAGKTGSVRRIPFYRILEDSGIASELTGKLVLIGATSPDLHDEQATPFSRGVPMPGVEIQAHIANMALQGYSLTPIPRTAETGIILLVSLLVSLFFALFPRSKKPVVFSVAIGVLLTALLLAAFDQGTLINIIHIELAWMAPLGGLLFYRYTSTERERRELKNAFSRYVSKDVLDEMMRDPRKVKLGGEEKEATIFFSDVRGFTTMSEKMTPTQLTTFLNRYLTIMTDLIMERRGVVDKYIGDAIMAFWGAPLSNPRHPIDAVETALEMTEALAVFNASNTGTDDPQIDIGIGLNSGSVTAGNMGSEKRFDYTVMGDAVNLASRLEGLTKQYGVHIIISEFTRALLDDKTLAEKGILVREVDKVKVKGKKLPVTIYEIADRTKKASVQEIFTAFEEARNHYYRGDWHAALTELRRILEQAPSDGPSKLLHERCLYFSEHPPETWDGVYELKTK